MSAPAAARSQSIALARPALAWVGVYVAALVGAEAVAAFAPPVAGAGAAGAVLLVLVGHQLLSGARVTRVYAALAVIPLLRLAGLGLARHDQVLVLAMSGVPVLVAVVLSARTLELPGVLALGEIERRSQWQAGIAALCLAAVAATALDVAPLTGSRALPALGAAAVAAFVFAGVLEELVFRGIVQGALDPVLGAWSVPVADLLFTAAYLGSGSAAYTAFMAVFGLACGWWVRRTRSLAGAALAHGALAVWVLVLHPVLS
jgi:membrane protease YdiL (CAAX protease family)